MAETHAESFVPHSEMDDVPIILHRRNPTISNLQYLKSSEKPKFRWLGAVTQSVTFMRFAFLLVAALFLFSLSIVFMGIQYSEDNRSSTIEKVIRDRFSTEYNNFEVTNGRKTQESEKLTGQSFDGMFSSNLGNRQIRKIQKREILERAGLKNDEGFSMDLLKLHRVQTGSEVPRESETVPGNALLFNEMQEDSNSNLHNVREIEKNEKIHMCKRSIEQCRSILESMQSLIKTTGDNVDSLNKLMSQIKTKEESQTGNSRNFQAFLQCIECNKMTNKDSITFVNDSEFDEEPVRNGGPGFDGRHSQMTNTLTIAEILNNSSASDAAKHTTLKVDEVNSKQPERRDQKLETTMPNDEGTTRKIVTTPTTTRRTFTSPVPLQKPPTVPFEADLDAPPGPSSISNFPGSGDSMRWAETRGSQTAVEKSSSESATMTIESKSRQDGGEEYGARMAYFDPRITTGTQHQPAKGVYDGSSMMHPTAETTKTSQQVQYTPPISWMPVPICFSRSSISGPPSGPPFKQSSPGMTFPASSPGVGGYSSPMNQFPQRGYGFPGYPTGPGFGPMQYHQQPGPHMGMGQQFPYRHPPTAYQQNTHIGPTASGMQNFPSNFGNFPTGPGHAGRSSVFCTFMPAPTYQFSSLPGISEFQRNVDDSSELVSGGPLYDPASMAKGANYPAYTAECAPSHKRCVDGSYCVPRKSWCNGRVDCPDASDERQCSCRDRVNKDRICDGYFDCPRGEDELGCFGCPSNSFSCEVSTKTDQAGNCVPWSNRCDGLKQCSNEKDERDCNLLTQTYIENRDLFTVGYTSGYLHKNWQGQWYPVCTPTESWAMEACVAETGFLLSEPLRIVTESMPSGEYPTAYLVQSKNGEIKVVPTCYGKAIFVRCPEIPCGTRIRSSQEIDLPYDRYEDSLLGNSKNRTNFSNATTEAVKKISNEIKNGNQTEEDLLGESRVVGGRASQPQAWPFLVAIRKDGHFSCGGVIINPYWILTAAHCVDGFTAHYYEIQAGLLRRLSFSPMAQTRRASYIKMHPNYQREILKNDLALIRLDEPLLFNRWIRPACLPKSWLKDSRKEPLPDTTCVTAGWGAEFEHGRNPDHLREVEIPIARECKKLEDRNDAEICAGVPQGGRDACQGDSGGPLMCSYGDSKNQWYVAGIVSHGEGCARPNFLGAYTKVSRFVDWIYNVIESQESYMLGPKPRKLCPGFTCAGGLGKCLPANKRCDGVVNCLDAEDEINCRPQSVFREQNIPQSSDDDANSKIVGEIAPSFIKDDATKNKTRNLDIGTATTAPDPKVLTTIDDENSTTKNSVEVFSTTAATVKNNSQAISTDVTGFDRPTTTTKKPQSFSPQSKQQRTHFTCTRLIQSLPIAKRCNRVSDCEDGTDEDNCTCRDYLSNLYPKAICNGHVDCHDGSDEENCEICKPDEFVCGRSGTCVSRTKLCDHRVDCDNKEDELDCFALTNGNYVILDFDKRPHLNLEGVVTQWKSDGWYPLCIKQTDLPRLSDEFCEYFGFGSADAFEKIKVRNYSLDTRQSTRYHAFPYEYPPSYVPLDKDYATCDGIYIRCKSVLSANTSNLIVTNPTNDKIDYLWPWQASIFVNGLYHCPAILLEHSWLMTSLQCVQNLDLGGNYTTALVGMAPTYLYVDSPYQQVTPVDTIKVVPKLDAALLHLKSPVNVTRYVQPIFGQKRIFPATRKDVCVATGVDEKFHTETTFLKPVPEPCPHCHRCYKNATVQDCKNETLTNWSGTIVCRGSGTWYPAAIFHKKDLLCGFQSTQTLTGIDYGNAHITEIMEEDLKAVVGPVCDGVRCALGKCIPWNKVCDGINDCRDGSDENEDYCGKKKKMCETTDGIGCKCSKSELRCTSGQCVPKEAFCNYKIDCDDGSDETAGCTCADYLRLTQPDRLCNNVRDCLDKSDENNADCLCKDASFKCSGGINATEICVSQDFVCDGEVDCPNGEDEKICRTVRGTLKDPVGTGQVLQRSYGIWHSECFPSPITSVKEISDLCRSMRFNNGEALMFDNNNNPYGSALIIKRDEFYTIRMNAKTWIVMRNNRPLAELAKTEETCHRAFVSCK